MSVYQRSYSRVVKGYDKELFLDRNQDGVLCVFRHSKRFELVVETEGYKLMNLKSSREYVFALTDTWGLNGSPRDWGTDDVLDHIKKIDSQSNAKFLEEADALNERVDESRKRAMRNDIEAFFHEERRAFAKATDDILTHSLDKTETKRRLKDKRIK